MTQTIKVTIDSSGHIKPLNQERIPPGDALLTFPIPKAADLLLFSESSLAKEWLSEDEERAWECLQPVK